MFWNVYSASEASCSNIADDSLDQLTFFIFVFYKLDVVDGVGGT